MCLCFRVLLRGGADVNAQDFDGWTPLHAAAHWCQHDACELLVKYFCDIDLKNYVVSTNAVYGLSLTLHFRMSNRRSLPSEIKRTFLRSITIR